MIGGILRRPAGVFENVAQNSVRDAAVVVAHADVGPPDLVLAGYGLDLADELVLAGGVFQLKLSAEEDVLRASQVDEFVQRLDAHSLQHVFTLIFGRSDVTSGRRRRMRRR